MRIVIAGAGEVGVHLAKLLSGQNHDIVIIDDDGERLHKLDGYDVLSVNGSTTSLKTLEEAQTDKANLFVAVTFAQDTNIVACILASKLGAQKTIARIDSSEFLLRDNRNFFSDQGVTHLVYPERIAAKEVVTAIRHASLTDMMDFSGGRLSLLALKIEEDSPLIDKTLMDMTGANIQYCAVAIVRDGKTIIPHGKDIFLPGDVAYLITDHNGLRYLSQLSSKEKLSVRNVMILGGSRIARLVAKEISKQYSVKIIEKNREHAYNLTNELDNVLVLNVDGSNMEALMEEGLDRTDVFAALTDDSETNIIACVWAKNAGVKRVIAEVENPNYIALAEMLGIDSIINRRLIAAGNIYKYTLDGEISLMKTMTGAIEADVLEYVAQNNSAILKAPVKDLDFPKDAIIGGIIRGTSGFIVSGQTMIQPGDHVVVFAKPDVIGAVDKFFV